MIPVTTEPPVAVNNGELPMMLTTTGSFRTDDRGLHEDRRRGWC